MLSSSSEEYAVIVTPSEASRTAEILSRPIALNGLRVPNRIVSRGA